jgi:hypothetical protein
MSEGVVPMLSKCANPKCESPFNYFNEGKLFEFDFDLGSATCLHRRQARKAASARKIFWLCGACAATLTLECQDGGEVITVPLQPRHRNWAA